MGGLECGCSLLGGYISNSKEVYILVLIVEFHLLLRFRKKMTSIMPHDKNKLVGSYSIIRE